MSLDKERPEQKPYTPISNVYFSNQRHGRKASINRLCADTNSNRKRNTINTETQAKTHLEIVEVLNPKNDQTTLFQFQLTSPIVQRLGGFQSRNK